jgi:hypothetical protein
MDFLKEIYTDINWRMSELASLKTIPFRYNLLQHHNEMLIKYSIPSFYAIWEGFVKNSFTIYTREINSLGLGINECHLNILTHALTSVDKLKLENPRYNFLKKKEFISLYQEKISEKLLISTSIPTKSNVDFKVINDILERFNLNSLPNEYENKLNKLLFFRNSIAHGENSIPINTKIFNEFSSLINDLMGEIFDAIEDGYLKRTFMNNISL